MAGMSRMRMLAILKAIVLTIKKLSGDKTTISCGAEIYPQLSSAADSIGVAGLLYGPRNCIK